MHTDRTSTTPTKPDARQRHPASAQQPARSRGSAAVSTARCSLMAAALVGAMLITAGPAQAQATITHFSFTHTETFTAPMEGCLPEDFVGAVTVTETFTGQRVDTGKVATVRGVLVVDYHLSLPDGAYVQSWLNRDLVVFVANPPHTVSNVVTQDFRTLYTADGTPTGTLTIHAGNHLTYDDSNGNRTPDPGEISAEFDYFRLRCG